MSALFVRNENGRGYQPTERGKALLRIWDVASWIMVLVFFATLLTQGVAPWWLFAVAAPFFIAPFFLMMFLTGRGPISALMHYARRQNAGDSKR